MLRDRFGCVNIRASSSNERFCWCRSTESIVQVRAVILILIALLAIVRKLIIIDISPGEASQLLVLAAATLSLGGVYWLIREHDRRERE
jgi:uncharacterized membrane protein (DUF373 family)